MNGKRVVDSQIKVPLKTLNRHGLIAWVTGTGKTKRLQMLAEQLSLKGIPMVLMGLKGELSGLVIVGDLNEVIVSRSKAIGGDHNAGALPLELMTIGP